MRSFFLNRQLRRIEREANDDLLQVLELGAHYFSTPELYDLLDRVQEQRQLVSQKLDKLYRFGILTPVFFLATFLASYFQIKLLAILFISAVPVMLVLFSYRSMRLRRDHPTYYDSEAIEKAIRQELHRREGSSIF